MSTLDRLEYLRGQIRAECISYGEIAELEGLAAHIAPGDVELLEWAGVPEFPEPTAPLLNEAQAQRIARYLCEAHAYEYRSATVKRSPGDDCVVLTREAYDRDEDCERTFVLVLNSSGELIDSFEKH